MAIAETYNEVILEQVLLQILREGIDPTVDEIERRFSAFLAANDTSKPLLRVDIKTHLTAAQENSSVLKHNETDRLLLQDLSVLYKESFKLGTKVLEQADRWKAEVSALEARLKTLEEELVSELLVSRDIEGYFGYVQDLFQDASLVDPVSTVLLDVGQGTVSIPPVIDVPGESTRIFLQNITDSDVQFTVLSRRFLQATTHAPGTTVRGAFSDQDSAWSSRVYLTNNTQPVSVELKIRLDPTIEYEATKLNITLLTSGGGGSTQVTPFHSLDGINYSQFATPDPTKSILDTGTFVFPKTTLRFLKIIFTKTAQDLADNGLYVYEFGARDISLYKEGFSTTTVARLISRPLSLPLEETTGQTVQPFNRVTCEVCERIPEATGLSYFVAVSNDSSFSSVGASWQPIDPRGRINPPNPIVLNLGDLTTTNPISARISYDTTVGVSAADRNPARTFTLIQPGLVSATITASNRGRYVLLNPSDRILNTQLHPDLPANLDTLQLWRNVGDRASNLLVRETGPGIGRNGWGFEEPYYKTTVLVSNPNGMDINLGPREMVIDSTSETETVRLVLGTHQIKVHKDNWFHIDARPDATLATLIAADPLYPYNHKLLIEGYVLTPTSPENPYEGVDRYAEALMSRVGIMDLVHNVPIDDYSKYAIDFDTGDTASARPSSRVFVLKVNENIADFMNETFLVSFSLINQLFRYIRFRADFRTDNASLSPNLDSWRLRLGS